MRIGGQVMARRYVVVNSGRYEDTRYWVEVEDRRVGVCDSEPHTRGEWDSIRRVARDAMSAEMLESGDAGVGWRPRVKFVFGRGKVGGAVNAYVGRPRVMRFDEV